MAGNLTGRCATSRSVTTAVANGDLSKKITVEAKGEVAGARRARSTRWSTSSRSFAAEVTRVAREVGTEGKLGGQAEVKGVSGTWRDLTENVNSMAANLTDQVRNIAQVATAVANGDLSQKITVEARGEILELKETHQHDGRPAVVVRRRGHARRRARSAPRASSAVRPRSRAFGHLARPDRERQPARRQPDHAGARDRRGVHGGDPGRPHAVDPVEAQGEVAELKDNINQMIANLRETTCKNAEQDWLKTNLARISGLMQGQRDLDTVSPLIMSRD